MPIAVEECMLRMMERQKSFGNVVNEGLKDSWKQSFNIFNKKTDSSDKSAYVLMPATGSGKTQAAIVYSAMSLGLANHPGILIITRLKKQADDVADQICELYKEYRGIRPRTETAIAYHSGKRDINREGLSSFPVLVITHAAFLRANDYDPESGRSDTWDWLYRFKDGNRKLVIIDEAIDLVQDYTLSQEQYERLLRSIDQLPDDIRKQVKESIDHVSECGKDFEAFGSESKPIALSKSPKDMDLGPLKKALSEHLRIDLTYAAKENKEFNGSVISNAIESLTAIEQFSRSGKYYYNRPNGMPTFNSTRLIKPKTENGFVILDATGDTNLFYSLHEDIMAISPHEGIRNYQNVTIHVSYGHLVGQKSMRKKLKMHCKELASYLEGHLSFQEYFGEPTNKTLIITHKDLEEELRKHVPEKCQITHWGNVDGSNEWKDCDTVIVFGIPYKPETSHINTFFATRGFQDTDWLREKGKRKHKPHGDIKEAIKTGQIITDITQAVNRAQCRQIIDEDGNCPKTDIYILLPTEKEGKKYLKGIISQMENIQIVPWDYPYLKQEKKGAKKKDHEKVLSDYLIQKLTTRGQRIRTEEVQKTCGLGKTTFRGLITQMKKGDTKDYIVHSLDTRAISYCVVPDGGTRKGFFVKN